MLIEKSTRSIQETQLNRYEYISVESENVHHASLIAFAEIYIYAHWLPQTDDLMMWCASVWTLID